jgi:hypothetical protein
MDAIDQYVIKNYAPLMTPAEAAAHQRLLLTNRATHGETSSEAQQRVTASAVNMRMYPDACTDDPEVLALAQDGLERFIERVATRIMRDYRRDVTINRCSQCDAVLETPTSVQCAACGGGAAEAGASA